MDWEADVRGDSLLLATMSNWKSRGKGAMRCNIKACFQEHPGLMVLMCCVRTVLGTSRLLAWDSILLYIQRRSLIFRCNWICWMEKELKGRREAEGMPIN